jgi:hypothetical protein
MSRIPAETRQKVRDRANGRCEYCLKLEEYGGGSFHVDHIIAQKHKGADDLENLAWACFRCNVSKGTDIASVDVETQQLTLLYNPRLQIWHEHFFLEIDHATIVGQTSTGRVSVDILDMNHPEQLSTRRYLLDAGIWD